MLEGDFELAISPVLQNINTWLRENSKRLLDN